MNETADVSTLPNAFCWTRFGTEAGESIEQILERKERERSANNGVFLWGIGNSVAPAMADLVRRFDAPEALFSPIRSRPRNVDVRPGCVVRWTDAEDLFGAPYRLPEHTHVTSRWNPGRPSTGHYALVCGSPTPISLGDHGYVRFCELRNLRSGAPLGASQVTAVVERAARDGGPPTALARYLVALRVRLVAPFFVRLLAPEGTDPCRRRVVHADAPIQLRL